MSVHGGEEGAAGADLWVRMIVVRLRMVPHPTQPPAVSQWEANLLLTVGTVSVQIVSR